MSDAREVAELRHQRRALALVVIGDIRTLLEIATNAEEGVAETALERAGTAKAAVYMLFQMPWDRLERDLMPEAPDA